MKPSLLALLLCAVALPSCGSEGSVSPQNSAPSLGDLVREGRYEEVVATLEPLRATDGLDAQSWLRLAEARVGQNELPKAERVLRDGLAAHPADLGLSLLLSRLYQSLGQVTRAAEVLEGAAAEGGESADYQLELGVVRGRLNQLEPAREAFARAAELGADTADVEYNLGVILSAVEDHEGAIGHFEAALAAAPDRAHVKRELATSLFHADATSPERAEAVAKLLDEVLEAAPEDWRAWALLGETQMVLGDPVAAQAYLTNALKFSQNEPTVEARYVVAARAAKAQLEAEGVVQPAPAARRGAPPIPASVQERMRAAQQQATQAAGEGSEPK